MHVSQGTTFNSIPEDAMTVHRTFMLRFTNFKQW